MMAPGNSYDATVAATDENNVTSGVERTACATWSTSTAQRPSTTSWCLVRTCSNKWHCGRSVSWQVEKSP